MIQPQCHLYFILARQASVGVVFRRGPSKWTQLIRWDVGMDAFEPGQWFKGRIYEGLSDLSPDGTKLVYFARKENRARFEGLKGYFSELEQADVPETTRFVTNTWTAVSKPPYLTALALWPACGGADGGGEFVTNEHLLLYHDPRYARPHHEHQPRGLTVQYRSWSEALMYEQSPGDWQRTDLEGSEARVKRCPVTGSQLFVRHMREAGKPTCRYYIRSAAKGVLEALPEAERADWDRRGRLIYCAGGKLLARTGSDRERLLADFTDAKPQQVAPPEWATTW